MSFRRNVVHGASEDRLQKLMTERLQPDADREAVDRRIWDLFGEEWCVMATDLAGFSAAWRSSGSFIFCRPSTKPSGC